MRIRSHRSSRWQMHRKRSRGLRLRQLFKGRVLICLGVLLSLGFVIYLVFFTTLFLIQSVELGSEYKDINVTLLQEFIGEQVSQKNTLFLDVAEIGALIYDKFPEVSALQCDRKVFSQTLDCQAIGYELIAVIKSQGNKYYINENGVIIAYDGRKLGLPVFDLVLNPIYAGISDEELDPETETAQRSVFDISIGKIILDPSELDTILRTIARLEAVLEYRVISAQYVQVAGELTLTSKAAGADLPNTDHELTILLDLRRNLDQQFNKLRKAKEVIDFNVVNRIDLSIDGEKIFYR